jgi:hypothetical protein
MAAVGGKHERILSCFVMRICHSPHAIMQTIDFIVFCLGWVEGFEPSTTGTTIRRSTKLSYTHREDFLF